MQQILFEHLVVRFPSDRAFMQEKSLTPAEKGTITHLVMQHIDLHADITIESIQQLIANLIQRELLTEEQQGAIEPQIIVDFFQTDIGQRMRNAAKVRREVPFTMSLPANIAYPDWQRRRRRGTCPRGY